MYLWQGSLRRVFCKTAKPFSASRTSAQYCRLLGCSGGERCERQGRGSPEDKSVDRGGEGWKWRAG